MQGAARPALNIVQVSAARRFLPERKSYPCREFWQLFVFVGLNWLVKHKNDSLTDLPPPRTTSR